MKKKYIYAIAAAVIILVIIFGIKAIIKSIKQSKENAAWKTYESAQKDIKSGKFYEAIQKCETALPSLIQPGKKAKCLALMGEAYGKTRNVIDSEEKFNKAVECDRKNYTIYLRFGRMYFENAQGRPKEKAKKEYEKALDQLTLAFTYCDKKKNRKDLQDLLFMQADILENFKVFGEAKKKYGEIVEIGENYPDEKSKFFTEAKKRYEILEKE